MDQRGLYRQPRSGIYIVQLSNTLHLSDRLRDPLDCTTPSFNEDSNMGLLSSHKSKPTASGGGKQKRNAPDLDRQRALAQAVGNPRVYWQEAAPARYDVDTLAMIARPVPANAGIITLEALHGGAWTKEELAFSKAISKARQDLDHGMGMAKQCIDTAGGKSDPGMDDAIRDSAQSYQDLVKAWRAFSRTKDKTWAGRMYEQIGPLAGTALGLI